MGIFRSILTSCHGLNPRIVFFDQEVLLKTMCVSFRFVSHLVSTIISTINYYPHFIAVAMEYRCNCNGQILGKKKGEGRSPPQWDKP